MIRFERRILIDSLIIGGLLTLIVVAADLGGLLTNLENWLYDLRARTCQRFSPPPTDKLVHMDIDDRALEVIGAWPWPRSRLAEILEEIRLAGPKTVALDILFAEAQEKRYEPDASNVLVPVDHDANLAAAMKRLDNVILAVSFAFAGTGAQPPIVGAMTEELSRDLRLSEDAVVQRLRGRGFTETDLPAHVRDNYLVARRVATYELIRATPSETADQATQRLLGGQVETASPLARLVAQQHAKVQAEQEVRQFARPIPAGAPTLLPARLQLPPIPAMTRSAAAVGFVDYLVLRDGIVRSVPLVVESDSRIYPQMGLAMACWMLGTRVEDLRLSENRLILPRPGMSDLSIPVRRHTSASLGRDATMLLDIPFFGDSAWQTMYDWPTHQAPKQHLSINTVWDICQTQQKISANNLAADDALKFLLSKLDESKLKEFGNDPDATDRSKWIDQTLHEASEWLKAYAEMKPEDLDEDGRHFLAAAKALQRVQASNAELSSQLEHQRAELATQLKDRAVLIGWIATAAAADFVPTSLHAKSPGVVVHGVIFNALMTGELWQRMPRWVTVAMTLALGLLVALAAGRLGPLKALSVALLLGAAYLLLNGVILFDYANRMVGAAGPVCAVALVWSGCTVSRILIESSERERIRKKFGHYVDRKLVDHVLEQRTDLGPQLREMTVVFTDLAGFTELSERLGERTVLLLNEFMGLMVPVIRDKHQGYVNKFLGDGIMFFFGAPIENPNHARDAVATVLDMRAAMEPFNAKLRGQGLPPLVMRAGISTGKMVVGDAGSFDQADYTVLGDVVNLGARLESANKALGTEMLISGRTAEMLNGQFLLRPVGNVRVVGKNEAVHTFEVIGHAMGATDTQSKLIELSRCIVDSFRERDFHACLKMLDDIESAHGPTKLTQLYRELCARYQLHPPADGFAGEISLSEK